MVYLLIVWSLMARCSLRKECLGWEEVQVLCHHQSYIKTTRSGRHMPMYDILSPVKITSNYHRETERAKAFMRYEDQHHTSPLLGTKLHLPALTPRLVARARLLHRLSSGLQGRLTLISAAAGSGKTTLLC